jgi:hypothetical protein
MTTVRDIVDPGRTLPYVEFCVDDRDTQWDYTRESVLILDGRDQFVGSCDLITYPEKMHFDGINVLCRGRGFGLASYLLAIELALERGLRFETQDATQSVHARRIWVHLASLGVATVDVPFRQDRSVKSQRVFRGRYAVLPEAARYHIQA